MLRPVPQDPPCTAAAGQMFLISHEWSTEMELQRIYYSLHVLVGSHLQILGLEKGVPTNGMDLGTVALQGITSLGLCTAQHFLLFLKSSAGAFDS